ncbi:MAG: hypothetical protein KAR42_12985 [candidate division Zixibacteria bacterium]|nr:hypothetical protein [candidate division Zixibacteria bacterium]
MFSKGKIKLKQESHSTEQQVQLSRKSNKEKGKDKASLFDRLFKIGLDSSFVYHED